MILWLILGLLIIAISFILAWWSMKDYQEIPSQSNAEYGLFLIRQTANFNVEVLDLIRKFMLEQGLIIGIERLFKGKKTALVIFGPKKILEQFSQKLELMELEDYTNKLNHEDMLIWEIGIRGTYQSDLAHLNNIFQNIPDLSDEEQFFWQVILGATDKDLFQTQIRTAIVFASSSVSTQRRDTLAAALRNFNADSLVKIPRPFSLEQMTRFYKLRSLSKDSQGPTLTSAGVMRLLKIS